MTANITALLAYVVNDPDEQVRNVLVPLVKAVEGDAVQLIETNTRLKHEHSCLKKKPSAANAAEPVKVGPLSMSPHVTSLFNRVVWVEDVEARMTLFKFISAVANELGKLAIDNAALQKAIDG